MQKVKQVDFEKEVLKSDRPVVVYFGAEAWCAPCKAMAPALKDVSEENASKAKFLKVEVDEEDGLVAQYNVMAIPTLLIFKEGKVVGEATGGKTKEELTSFLNQNV